jgi:hypothetical protein
MAHRPNATALPTGICRRAAPPFRADLAHFALLEAEQGAHIGKIVGIGY